MLERFKYANFNPSPELLKRADTALDYTLLYAPGGSKASAMIEKVGNRFHCFIDVRSDFGRFVGESMSIFVEDAVGVAVRRLDDQLRAWREKRHPNDIYNYVH